MIGETLAGDDAHPAVPGYDPDLSAELYTTNGDTDTHMQENYGAFGFTPEMGTCEAASDANPDDEWEAEDCGTGFEFPDDEALVEAEFRAQHPVRARRSPSRRMTRTTRSPSSAATAPDFRARHVRRLLRRPADRRGDGQARLKKLQLNYRINNGKTKTVNVSEWRGGERYGHEMKRYYAEFRGEVKGARAGDRVKVWFSRREARASTGRRPRRSRATPFTYTVKSDTGAKVLVLANEDYTGFNPDEAPVQRRPALSARRT